MVRLLLLHHRNHPSRKAKFQSHNGAIAARAAAEKGPQRYAQFQSHNGAIAASKCARTFASNKTVSIPQWCDCCMNAERPARPVTYVSIPQWCDCCPSWSPTSSINRLKFQSHNGAIAATMLNALKNLFGKVSIPQWCDCCGKGVAAATGGKTVSIPQWCDCCMSLG